MIHALITIPYADIDRANEDARSFGSGTAFHVLAYANNSIDDGDPVGSYCAANFSESVIVQVSVLIGVKYPGATITPYRLGVDACPLGGVFEGLSWRQSNIAVLT